MGIVGDAYIGDETGEVAQTPRMYDMNPHSLDPQIPEAFRQPAAEEGEATAEPEELPGEDQMPAGPAEMTPSVFTPEEEGRVVVFGLQDALAYAIRHARDLQDAKEELYLAALALSLERHLWTPQLSAESALDYALWDDLDLDGPGQAAGALDPEELDRTYDSVSQMAVSQRLPLGGSVTARVLHHWMRTVRDHVSKGESAQAILEAEIPLLRGAGRVAYEDRYTAERGLVYAARSFERFRRSFLVEVAAEYFNQQLDKAAIENTFKAYESRRLEWEKADFMHRIGRSRTVFDVPRVRAAFRSAEANLVRTKENYESSLDRFKILIGMPVETLLDVVSQEHDQTANALDAFLAPVDEATAVDVALHYRLDLLTSADRIDDARRGILVAKNAILPDLDFTSSLTLDSNPGLTAGDVSLDHDSTTWRAGVLLRMDDRKQERNAYRSSLVSLRRAERDYDLASDSVRADVRRTLRRIDRQRDLRMIQTLNVEENEVRLDAATAQFDLGRSTNRNVVDAEDDLLRARNELAAALAGYRVSVLEFRRDTGTLRVTSDGRWGMPQIGEDWVPRPPDTDGS
jgi:outer membrane protein TolC